MGDVQAVEAQRKAAAAVVERAEGRDRPRSRRSSKARSSAPASKAEAERIADRAEEIARLDAANIATARKQLDIIAKAIKDVEAIPGYYTPVVAVLEAQRRDLHRIIRELRSPELLASSLAPLDLCSDAPQEPAFALHLLQGELN